MITINETLTSEEAMKKFRDRFKKYLRNSYSDHEIFIAYQFFYEAYMISVCFSSMKEHAAVMIYSLEQVVDNSYGSAELRDLKKRYESERDKFFANFFRKHRRKVSSYQVSKGSSRYFFKFYNETELEIVCGIIDEYIKESKKFELHMKRKTATGRKKL